MKIIRSLNNIKIDGSVIALGNFDGLHLGHQTILSELQKISEKENLQKIVMSFEPHPSKFFLAKKDFRICAFQDKISLLREQQIDYLFLLRFTKELANLEAEDFLNILCEKLGVKHIVIGYDFIFGKNRKGNKNLLEKFQKEKGYKFTQVEKQACTKNLLEYSSTNIRSFLQKGKIKNANILLGKKYFISGRVIEGNRLGRTIGVPTANIAIKDLCVLRYGVYLTRVVIDGESYNAISNYGVKPSIKKNDDSLVTPLPLRERLDEGLDKQNPLMLETHIFNFEQDIYGKKIKVEFLDFLREEKKFSNLIELKENIYFDIKQAQEIYENSK